MALISATDPNLFRFVTEFEHEVPFIYCDHKGYPTVGIGHLIFNPRWQTLDDGLDEIRRLYRRYGFIHRNGGGVPLSKVEAELEGIMRMPAEDRQNQPAERFWGPRHLAEMTHEGCVRLKHDDTRVRISALSGPGRWLGPAMATLPLSVQIVVVDMAFNAGVRALRETPAYGTFRDAIVARDWPTAAREVTTGGANFSRPVRNRDRARLLLTHPFG